MRLATAPCWVALVGLAIATPAYSESAQLGRVILRDFAKCAVKNEPELARKAVLQSPAPGISIEELQKVFDAHCMGLWRMQLRANELAIRASFAEELARSDWRRWPDLNPSGVGPLVWAVPTEIKPGPGVGKIDPKLARQLLEAAKADAQVGKLGECIVRVSPGGAASVLNTPMDSKAEFAALKALAPQVARCVQSGETSAFTRTSLRYALALSYYRLAKASGAVAGASN